MSRITLFLFLQRGKNRILLTQRKSTRSPKFMQCLPKQPPVMRDRSTGKTSGSKQSLTINQLIQFSLVTECTYQYSKFNDGLFKYIDICKLLTFFRCSLTWEWLITIVYWARPLMLWASKVAIPASSWLKRLQEIWRALIREYLRFFHNFFLTCIFQCFF